MLPEGKGAALKRTSNLQLKLRGIFNEILYLN